MSKTFPIRITKANITQNYISPESKQNRKFPFLLQLS